MFALAHAKVYVIETAHKHKPIIIIEMHTKNILLFCLVRKYEQK